MLGQPPLNPGRQSTGEAFMKSVLCSVGSQVGRGILGAIFRSL